MKLFPVIELVDRYAIAKLKFDKTQANKDEFDFYVNQLVGYDLTNVELELDDLYEIHKQIWNLEAQLKAGKENELPLEEIGRRAIAIRDLNNKRIALKNSMANKLGCIVREVKQDHLSE